MKIGPPLKYNILTFLNRGGGVKKRSKIFQRGVECLQNSQQQHWTLEVTGEMLQGAEGTWRSI